MEEADNRRRKDSISGRLYIYFGADREASPTPFETSKVHHPLPLRTSTAEAEEYVDNVNSILDESLPDILETAPSDPVCTPGLHSSARLKLLYEWK